MPDKSWALVVGASRGLGLGLAAELESRGWNVVATVRDAAGEQRLRAVGGDLCVEHLDINDDDGIAALRRRLDATRFDLLFVNAGISPRGRGDAASTSRDEAAHVFLTNAVAPMRVARAFVDRIDDGGVVAFMSSGLGSVADKTDGYSPLYSASKAALNSLSRSFAASLGGRHITVLAIAPGWVRTDMGGAGARFRSRTAPAASSMCSKPAPAPAGTALSITAAARWRGSSKINAARNESDTSKFRYAVSHRCRQSGRPADAHR